MKLQGIKHFEIDSDGTNSRILVSYLSGAVISVPVSDKAAASLVHMSLCQQVRGRYIVKTDYGRYVARDENGFHTTGKLATALRLTSPAAADFLIAAIVREWPLLEDRLQWSRVRFRMYRDGE